MPNDQQAIQREAFVCPKCGGPQRWSPAENALGCVHCGTVAAVSSGLDSVSSHDLQTALNQQLAACPTEQQQSVGCPGCDATLTVAESSAALSCPFCAVPIVAPVRTERRIRPTSVLPFKISRGEAERQFDAWRRQCWFAPGSFRKQATVEEKLRGIYLPFWTYQCSVHTTYELRRRIEFDPEQQITGPTHKTESMTEQIHHVHVPASHSLPAALIRGLEPWDTANLEPYQDAFLTGFDAERYQIDPLDSFEQAEVRIRAELAWRSRIQRQRANWTVRLKSMNYEEAAFEHVLFPIWISAYRYKGRVYRFVINARTGEVQAERPFSNRKLFASGLAAMLGLSTIMFPLFELGAAAHDELAPHAQAAREYLTIDLHKPPSYNPRAFAPQQIEVDREALNRQLSLRLQVQTTQLKEMLAEQQRHQQELLKRIHETHDFQPLYRP